MARQANGSLWAWGYNNFGQVGDFTTTNKLNAVFIDNIENWLQVSSSLHTLAIKSNGTLWSWGHNSSGQLGVGTTSTSNTTSQQVGADSNWVQVATGDYHSLGLKSNGTLWAWGSNFEGTLGNGTTTGSNIPIQIGSATDWVKITAGPNY